MDVVEGMDWCQAVLNVVYTNTLCNFVVLTRSVQ